MADALEATCFEDGDRVVRQGEPGDDFYIIGLIHKQQWLPDFFWFKDLQECLLHEFVRNKTKTVKLFLTS